MAAYCSLMRNEEKDRLPPNYDVDTACECMHWACGRAYKTPIGHTIHAFIVHPKGIAMCEVRDDELLVVFRGTVVKMINELSRNVWGCGMDPTQLFDEGTTSCLPGEPRCHKMYVVRAFEVLFTWLQVDIFGGEAANRWGTFKKITVCGHSMGGSVSLLFAYLLKQTDNRLRALQPGQRMHVIGLSEFLEDPYLRASPSLDLERRGDFFFDHTTNRELPSGSVLLHPDCQISVYSFSCTQIGNFAFKSDFEAIVPNTYNHFLYWDPVTPIIFPWTFKPGHQLPIMVKKDNAKLFLNFVTGGVALHGPSPILFTSLHAYFDRHGADLQRLWSLLQPHVRSDPLVGKIGDVDGGDSNWMVIPIALEKRIHSDPALQRELFTGGQLDLTDDGLSYTWIDPAIVHSSSVVCNTLLVCFAIPATLITIGIMLVLTAVVLPLVLFPYVMYSHCVDQAFLNIGLSKYLLQRTRAQKAAAQAARMATTATTGHNSTEKAIDLEAPLSPPPRLSFVKVQREMVKKLSSILV